MILGQPSEASKAFQSALQLLASTEANDSLTVPSNAFLKLDDDVPEFVLGQSRFIIPDLQAKHFFVYNHAITITEPTVPKVSDETISQHSSAVLFNWALVFHREGMLGSEGFLKKASLLYARCLHILSLSVAVQFKQTTSVLAMLAFNNQAQIHYELCDYSESSKCMAQATSILQRTPNLECCTLSLGDVTEEIYLNTMLSPTAAAAA